MFSSKIKRNDKCLPFHLLPMHFIFQSLPLPQFAPSPTSAALPAQPGKCTKNHLKHFYVLFTHLPGIFSGPSSDPHPLPDLDIFNLSSGNASSNVSTTKKPEEAEEEIEDTLPLFYQYKCFFMYISSLQPNYWKLFFLRPGKRGFYSPVQGRATPKRLNAFRNVGRLIGLCLLQVISIILFLIDSSDSHFRFF